MPDKDFQYVHMQITFAGDSTLLRVSGRTTGTYVIYGRVPGQIGGEGQGIFLSNDGEGAIWNGPGIGTPRAMAKALPLQRRLLSRRIQPSWRTSTPVWFWSSTPPTVREI
jgi:hypothetical protein